MWTTMVMLVCLTPAWADDDLTVLSESRLGVEPGRQLERYLAQQAFEQLDRRTAAFESMKSRAECREWQRQRREFFVQQLGGFPERTPLNARVTGRLQGQGYRVENVIFESRPGHHVTANLYLPETPGPHPGVIVPCGHSHDGKAAGGYQRASILLARNGMAALCYDPIGQGERYQILDHEHEHEFFPTSGGRLPVPHPRVKFLCTMEHTMMGLGSILLGSNVAQYRIWDGMRAIDYLQSRDDIIDDKIGCTGNSGGGTLTSYLMALDERIVAAAPACYLTTFRRLIESRGAQDAEQNIFGQLAFGMDEPDYVMMRAPLPTLICAGRRDATFDINGTWELFQQSKRFYARLGYPERVDLNDADLPHGFYLPQREAAARFLHRWLLGQDKEIHEVPPESLPDPTTDKDWLALSEGDWTRQQLYCTPAGQVLLMEGEKSVFQLNAEREADLRVARQAAWRQLDARQQRELVATTIGLPAVPPKPGAAQPPAAPRHEVVGTIQRDGYLIEKLILTVEPGLRLPALAFVPDRPSGQATLYLHGESMAADAAPGGPIEKLVGQGHLVLAAELRGIGETETGHHKSDYGRGYFGRDVQEIFLAYLIGRSYVGMRTGDVLAWSDLLAEYRAEDGSPRELHVVAQGEAAIPALHAAALQSDRYASVRLRNMIRSWVEIVRAPETMNQAVNVVHGALRHYDLPELIELAGGADRVQVASPADVR